MIPERASCSKAHANQMRLMLHGAAYWMWWKLRAACPRKSPWRRAQFDTLRLHLVKLAVTIVEKKTRITLTLPVALHAAGVLPTARAPVPALRCARPAKIGLTHERPDHP